MSEWNKSLEMGIFGTDGAAKGGPGGMREGGRGKGRMRMECKGGMSLERARNGFKGEVGGEVAASVLGVPQHASLFSPVADIPSPTNLVPLLSLA